MDKWFWNILRSKTLRDICKKSWNGKSFFLWSIWNICSMPWAERGENICSTPLCVYLRLNMAENRIKIRMMPRNHKKILTVNNIWYFFLAKRGAIKDHLFLWHSRIVPYQIDSSLCKSNLYLHKILPSFLKVFKNLFTLKKIPLRFEKFEIASTSYTRTWI